MSHSRIFYLYECGHESHFDHAESTENAPDEESLFDMMRGRCDYLTYVPHNSLKEDIQWLADQCKELDIMEDKNGFFFTVEPVRTKYIQELYWKEMNDEIVEALDMNTDNKFFVNEKNYFAMLGALELSDSFYFVTESDGSDVCDHRLFMMMSIPNNTRTRFYITCAYDYHY